MGRYQLRLQYILSYRQIIRIHSTLRKKGTETVHPGPIAANSTLFRRVLLSLIIMFVGKKHPRDMHRGTILAPVRVRGTVSNLFVWKHHHSVDGVPKQYPYACYGCQIMDSQIAPLGLLFWHPFFLSEQARSRQTPRLITPPWPKVASTLKLRLTLTSIIRFCTSAIMTHCVQ